MRARRRAKPRTTRICSDAPLWLPVCNNYQTGRRFLDQVSIIEPISRCVYTDSLRNPANVPGDAIDAKFYFLVDALRRLVLCSPLLAADQQDRVNLAATVSECPRWPAAQI